MEESGHPSHHGLTTGSNPVPPVGSRSPGTTFVTGTFLRKQRRLINNINTLQSNPTGQPKTLKSKASKLSAELENLGVPQIVQKYESEPNFLDYFGANPDDLLLSFEETE